MIKRLRVPLNQLTCLVNLLLSREGGQGSVVKGPRRESLQMGLDWGFAKGASGVWLQKVLHRAQEPGLSQNLTDADVGETGQIWSRMLCVWDCLLSLSGTQSPHFVPANKKREWVFRKHPRAGLSDLKSLFLSWEEGDRQGLCVGEFLSSRAGWRRGPQPPLSLDSAKAPEKPEGLGLEGWTRESSGQGLCVLSSGSSSWRMDRQTDRHESIQGRWP